jgi:hypothetical protein
MPGARSARRQAPRLRSPAPRLRSPAPLLSLRRSLGSRGGALPAGLCSAAATEARRVPGVIDALHRLMKAMLEGVGCIDMLVGVEHFRKLIVGSVANGLGSVMLNPEHSSVIGSALVLCSETMEGWGGVAHERLERLREVEA